LALAYYFWATLYISLRVFIAYRVRGKGSEGWNSPVGLNSTHASLDFGLRTLRCWRIHCAKSTHTANNGCFKLYCILHLHGHFLCFLCIPLATVSVPRYLVVKLCHRFCCCFTSNKLLTYLLTHSLTHSLTHLPYLLI